jgi:hypothetical protein
MIHIVRSIMQRVAQTLGKFRKSIKRFFTSQPRTHRKRSYQPAIDLMERRDLPAASFLAPAQVAGTVAVQLDPLANVTPGVQQIVTFGVPFTRGSVTDAQLAQVRVLKNGVEIPAFVQDLTPWRSIDDPAIDGQSVRVARIQITYTFSSLNPETITVQWGGPARTLNVNSMQDPRVSWHLVTSGTFVAADNVQEPNVLPVLPASYLALGMLDSQTTPDNASVGPTRDNPAVMNSTTFTGFNEYDSAEKNFFYTIINQNGSTPIDYKTDPEPWLYDRSSAMYQLYMRSGFATALQEAIRSTDFYVNHLGSDGFFDLKPGDPKYAYNESLAYTYWLLGDNRMLTPITTVTQAFDGTQTHWSPNLSFFTERNSGDKLLANEMAFEVTGNATFKSNVKTIVGDFIWHQNGAGGQLPATRVDGGLYHLGFQHDLDEVTSADVLVASSWMSALLVDPMVRVYGVWQDNAQIPDFIVRMGNFEKAASLTDANGQFGGTTRYPDYLMRPDGTPDNRSDTDVQHAMDVGAVAAWATYFAELRGTPDASLRQLANDLYHTYDVGVNFWTSTTDGYTVQPPRRYNWEYKNSASFAWALTAADAPSAAGNVQFSSTSFSVIENQPVATITVTRTHGSTGAISVNYSTANGTALAGSDYTATSGTLNFADGETSKTFTVPIINDTLVENRETVILTLSNPTGGASLASPATATLNIDSDDTTTSPITQTFQQGVNGYTGTTDLDFSNQYGGNGATTLDGDQLGVYQTTGTGAYQIEGLIRFDNLGITTHSATDAVVTAASLTLTADFGTTAATIRGYYVATPWSVAPGTDLGWITTGAGANWNTPGALGQGTDVLAGKSFLLPSVTGTQTVTIALDSAVVQSWIDNPNANQGILLVNQTTGAIVRIDASENATAAWRPKLSVSYNVVTSTFPGALQFSSPTFNVNENGGTATVTVTRTGSSTGAISVNFATSDGTATAGADYVATSGTLNFADGETSKTFTIQILDDNLVENNETILLSLSNPTGGAALGSQSTASVSIIDNDVPQPGALQFSTSNFTVNENQGTATITVTRTGGSNVPVTVNYATSNGTANAGADYTATSGTLSFGIGETSKTFTVPIIDDALVEGNETINLTLTGPTNGATLGSQTSATLTIVDNDTSGTVAATFQQGLNGYTGTTDASITTQNAQFTGGNGLTDFTSSQMGLYQLSGTGGYAVQDLIRFGNLGIAAGSQAVAATLTLSVDSWVANSTIRGYYLLAPWSATPGSDSSQLGWIHRGGGQDWNTPGALGQGTDVVAGKSFLVPGIQAVGAQSITVNLDLAVVQSWIDNPASNQGILLVNETTGDVLRINSSENSTTSFRPKLSINFNPAGSTSPGALQFSAAAYTVNENQGTATITVTRTGGSSGSVTVNYATSNGTAIAGSDYTATSGTLTFAPGETSKTFTVPIIDDTLVEPDETVLLTLTSPTGGATLGGQTTAMLTIHSDDVAQLGALQFSAASYTVNENQGTATITVTRTGGSSGSVTVNFATSDGTANAGSDYTATSGTLTFADGETSKTFTVPIIDDTLVEPDETVNLTLTSPTGGATLGNQTSATLTIHSDDVAPAVLQFSAASYTVNENQGTATITVTRTGDTSAAASVNFATSNGTATAGADYTATSGTLTFAAGDTSKTFTVPIIDDTLIEPDETINLTLTSPAGATLGTQSTATLTIHSDDVAQPGVLQFSAASFSANENQGVVTITVTRTGGSNVPVSVNFATSNGTATAGSDYTATSGTLNFAVGETSKTFAVTILDDTLVEGPETVTLTLTNATGGATLGTPATATLTIVDNDTSGQPTTATFQQGVNGYTGTTDVNISNQYAQFTSGNGTTTLNGSQMGVYQVTGTPGYTMESLIRFANLGIPTSAVVSAASITLNFYTWDSGDTIRGYYVQSAWNGAAGSSIGWLHRGTGQDWTTPGALGQGTDVIAGKSFVISNLTASGSQTRTFTLDPSVVQSWINNPSADQGILLVNETTGKVVQVSASEISTVANRPKLSITYTNGPVTPQPGALQFSNAAYSVSESGGTATITVTRTGGTSGSVTVNFATSNGTATAGSDYTATSGTLTFADGETTKTFTVPITNDNLVERNETINLTLSSPTGGATLGGQSTAVLTIQDTPVLQSITMSPSNPSIATGQTAQFTVTGHFSDGSSQTLTSGVTFSSSNTSIVTISSSGLASAVAAGSAMITAMDGSLTVSTTLTVTAASTNPTVGAHTMVFVPFNSPAGTLSTGPMTTQAAGSTVLAWIGRGQLGDFTAATAPTDNKGNHAVQLDVTHSYAPSFPNSGMALYNFPSFVGGANDIFSTLMPSNDEVTLSIVEIKNGGIIQDQKWVQLAAGATQTSLSVTTTGAATLVSFWTGDAASGPITATPGNGFTLLDGQFNGNNAVQMAVASKDVSAAGTYNVTWSATPQQTGYIWIVAVQHGTPPASQPGKLQFSTSGVQVNENAGTATVTVNRTGGSDGAVTVNYATSNGTATAGSDYTAASGTLTFAAGETSKTFTVPIIDDTVVEGNETVNLTLTSPSGGATLGSPASATLTIFDNDTAPSAGKFSDITGASGVAAIIAQKYQEDPNWWLSGEHLVDLDNDGDLDLFLDAHNGTSVVALNDGHGNFTRVTQGSWPDTEIHEMVDINGDGKVDLNATFQDGGSQWWINNSTPGHVNFTPTSVTRDTNTSRSQVLFDFNGDGNVDWFRSAPPGLVVDFGDGHGNFTEGSKTFTIPGTDSNNNASFIPGDFDGDGKIDLLVIVGGAYDGTVGKTMVWHNNGDMTFTDITAASGMPANGTVVKGVGDYNQDGKLDFIATENKTMPPVIYLNDGHGNFVKKANAVSGVAPETLDYAFWGTAVVTDFDNDGKPDIIMDGKYYLKVLRGNGDGTFTYMNNAWGIKDTAAASVDDGLTFGDIDGDGRLDIIGYDQTFPSRTIIVYHNDLTPQNWLNVDLVGLTGNANAAGATISIFAAGTNQLLWTEQVAEYDFQVATSYYGTNRTERHFGLGTRTNVDIVVRFASGKVATLSNVSANQMVQVLESTAI